MKNLMSIIFLPLIGMGVVGVGGVQLTKLWDVRDGRTCAEADMHSVIQLEDMFFTPKQCAAYFVEKGHGHGILLFYEDERGEGRRRGHPRTPPPPFPEDETTG
ncbi:unnamed protein product, partial [Amoebophrya sp. A25]|eukprot:GSA25T00002808001.1